MKSYGLNELRKMYLEFFESKGHLAMPSFSLVPHNDNSLATYKCRYGSFEAVFYRSGDPAKQRVLPPVRSVSVQAISRM